MTLTRRGTPAATRPSARQRWRPFAAALVLAPTLAAPLRAQAAVAPDAERLLKSSLAYVGQLSTFGFGARTALEVVLTSGQKIQLGGTLDAVVQRPDRMRVRRATGLDEQTYVYDGRSLALWSPVRNEYASLAAPDTNQPGAAGNRGVGAPGVGAPGAGAWDPGINQPGIAGNVGGVARQTVRRY